MSLSNRVSLDTDVVFLRNIFMFSTGTNNVPVSTNFIMAAGQYGQIGAVDTLRNIETYGVGYLPCTFSTFNGQMLSISSNVASSFVNSNQLFSVQNYLISSISSTNADLNAFSSYVVNELVPSTVSGITWVLSSLNSSFQGYVVGTTVTQAQLFSTTSGLIINTGNQISSYSTTTGNTITDLSNFFVGTGVNNVAFSNLSTYVSTFAASTNFSLISTGQNFTALSNYVRLTTASNSTYLAEISATVSELIDEIGVLSSLTTDPNFIIGYQSTLSNVRFGSNITISSINNNYKFGISTFTGPEIFMSTATFSSLSAASGFISSFGASRISTGDVTAEQLSSLTLHTSSIVANTVAAVAMAANDGYFVNTLSSAVMLTSSMQAQQIALNTVGSNYTLDVGGSINFTNGLFSNGTPFTPPVNVLGTLSTTANVWFGSNIMVSSINSNLYLSNGRLGIGAEPVNFPLEVTGTAQISFSVLTDNVSTGYILGGQMSSLQMYTSSLQANGIIADNLAIPILNTTTVNTNTVNAFITNSDNISTGYVLGAEVSSQQIYTSSLRTLQVAVGTVGSNYALDVGGDINFSGTMYKNGVEYPTGGGGSVNVLGTLSTAAAADTWFNSNINVSSINSGIYLSDGGIGIGTQTGIPTNGLTVTGTTDMRNTVVFRSTISIYPRSGIYTFITTRFTPRVGINIFSPNFDLDVGGVINASTVLGFSSMSTAVMQVSSLQAQQATVVGSATIGDTLTASNAVTVGTTLSVGGATTLSNTLNVIGQATFSNASAPVIMSNATNSNNVFFNLNSDSDTLLLRTSDGATTNKNYPIITLSNNGNASALKIGLGNTNGAGGWTAGHVSFYTYCNTTINQAMTISTGTGYVGIYGPTDSSNALRVGGAAYVSSNFAAGINGANNVLYVDDTNNRVGINCNAPTVTLDVDGDLHTSGSFEADSISFLKNYTEIANTVTVNFVKKNVAIMKEYPFVTDSNYILEVGGPTKFHSSISTLYTMQSAPRIWSYVMTTPVTAIGGITVFSSNYAATSQITSGSNYTVPYTGVYIINVTCGMSNQVIGNTQISLCNTTTAAQYDSRIFSPVGFGACSLQYAGTITQNDILILYANAALVTNGILNTSWIIQYLG